MAKWLRITGAALGAAAGGVALGVAAVVGGSVALARMAVTPEEAGESPVTVLDIEQKGSATIVWLRGEQSDLPGRYSFAFDDGRGHARFGDIVAQRGRTTARTLLQVDRGDLVIGARGRLTGWWYTSPEQLGLHTEHITYETELGPADAWIVHPKRAKKHRWAVHVHGRGALPEETIRGIGPLARAGITSMVISYRNDPGAPSGTHGRYGVGVSEARDIDAAIAEVRRRGAERVTLVGWSMGGTASLVAATAGQHQDVIDGLVLDSPAIDWGELLRYHATGRKAPRIVATLGLQMLGAGIVKGGEPDGIRFDDLTPEAFARLLQTQVLIHASSADTYVPYSGSLRLETLKPELVQVRVIPEAEHVRLWNVDPEGWERATESFVRSLPRPAWRG